MRKKAISVLLTLTMLFTYFNISVFSVAGDETAQSTKAGALAGNETPSFSAAPTASPSPTASALPTASPEKLDEPSANADETTAPDEITETNEGNGMTDGKLDSVIPIPDTSDMSGLEDFLLPVPGEEPEVKEETSVRLYSDGTETDITSNLTAANCTISNGSYIVKDLTTNNTIMVPSGVVADLTLENVTITSTSASPIKIEAGAELTLHLSGENTISSGDTSQANNIKGYAGIAVLATADAKAKLIIDKDSDGTLNVTSAGFAAAIGANRGTAAFDNAYGGFGIIEINGGTINAQTTGVSCAAIGDAVNCKNGGTVEINGGKIIATTTAVVTGGGAAIGSVTSTWTRTASENITINGGWLELSSNNNYALGGGTNMNIEINGGYIKATNSVSGTKSIGGVAASLTLIINGGSVDADFSKVPTDSDGNLLRKVTVSMPYRASLDIDLTEKEVSSSRGWSTYTDKTDLGRLYIFVIDDPDTTDEVTSFSVTYTSEDGSSSYLLSRNDICENTETSENYVYYLSVYNEERGDCECTSESISLEMPEDIPDTITVNKNGGSEYVQLKTPVFTPNECTYPTHDILSYEYEIVESGTRAYIDDKYLVVDYAAGSETFTLKVTVEVNGGTFSAEKTITANSNDDCKVFLSDGSIVITADEDDTMKITVGGSDGKVYSKVPKTEVIYIEQGSLSEVRTNIRVVGVSPTINLKDVNMNCITGAAITVSGNSTLTLDLSGTNKIYAAVAPGITGAEMTGQFIVQGDGLLEVESGEYAAIRGFQKITVDSGTLIARGGNANGQVRDGGAGIGGDSDHFSLGEIEINGGRVYAYGAGNAAGIGGSGSNAVAHYNGVNFSINGGMVYARSSGDGMGIGYGGSGRANSNTSIRVDGGNVDASLEKNPVNSEGRTVYLMTLSLDGVTDSRDVEYSITLADESDENLRIKTTTSEDGKLYLYIRNLTTNKRWIRVYSGNITYYYYTFIESNNYNEGTAVRPGAELSVTEFLIAGQTSESVIDNLDGHIRLSVPTNIKRDSIVPIISYNAADARPNSKNDSYITPLAVEYTERGGNAYLVGKYVLLGHNLAVREYSVEMLLEGEVEKDENGMQILDISRYSITITPDSVNCGGTFYEPNSAGYIVIGKTTENNLSIDAQMSSDKTIPPVTLKDVSIERADSNSALIIQEANVNITIDGVCTLFSSGGSTVWISALLYGSDVTITGKNLDAVNNILNINGGSSSSAVSLGSNSMTITDVAYNIIAGAGKASVTGSSTAGFYTDGSAYAHIVNNMNSASLVRPKLASDKTTPLYQLSASLDATRGENDPYVCTYGDKEYYIGDDNTLYLMLPTSEFEMTLQYNNRVYQGNIEIQNSDTMVTLHTVRVDNITADSTLLSFYGGTVNYTVEGTLIAGNVRFLAYPKDADTSNDENIVDSSYAQRDEFGNNIASLAFPYNPSEVDPVYYDVYYSTDGGITLEPVGAVVVNVNESVCYIYGFGLSCDIDIDGDGTVDIRGSKQVKSEFLVDGNNNHIINVTMPFDHIWQDYYYASEIDYYGSSVSPAKNIPAAFLSMGSYRYATYTVTSSTGDSERYMVRVYRETAPTFSSASFTSPQTSEGGTVSVTFTGSLLDRISHAENPLDRVVNVYLDGEKNTVATAHEENGTVYYTAEVEVPENNSDASNANHRLSVSIGDDYYTRDFPKTIDVPRKSRTNADISDFGAEGQVSFKIEEDDENNAGTISVVMPFDANLARFKINYITLADLFYASYEIYASTDTAHRFPLSSYNYVDARNSLLCVVTADNGEQKTYTITAEKQEAPVVTGIEFTDPTISHPGAVSVRVRGSNFENALNSVSDKPYVEVAATRRGDGAVFRAIAIAAEDGDGYIADVVLPDNMDDNNEQVYEISVNIGDLTTKADKNLTIRKKEASGCAITEFVLIDSDDVTVEIENAEDDKTGTISVYVPYNTDLRNLTPFKLTYSDMATCNPPVNTAADFGVPVTYEITAESGDKREYTVTVYRNNPDTITDVTVQKMPSSFADVENIAVDISGNFIPDRGAEDPNGPKDTLSFRAVCGDEVYYGDELDYGTSYGGHASGLITLNRNLTDADKEFTIVVTINDVDCEVGKITVPRRTGRKITKFEIDGEAGVITETENGGIVNITLPYNTDLSGITPTVEIDGDLYTSTNFEKTQNRAEYSAQYTISSLKDTDRVYTVYISRSGEPTVSAVTIAQPHDYTGGEVTVDFGGVFWDGAEVNAVAADGTKIAGEVTFAIGSAKAVFNIPTNNSTSAAEYSLEFTVDGFDVTPAESLTSKITVPRRTGRKITKFEIDGEAGVITETENGGTVNITLPYNTDLSSITPTVEIDGDLYTSTKFEKTQNRAEYSAQYTVSSLKDTDRVYTVYISRSGEPSITEMTIAQPHDYTGGEVTVDFGGVFWDGAEVNAVASDGTKIAGEVTFAAGSAKAVFDIPMNDSSKAVEYLLEFTVDGFNVTPAEGVTSKITVPRRTTFSFKITLPNGYQEGETHYSGTDITIDVPYIYAEQLSSIIPNLEFDSDAVSPAPGTAMNFSDFENPAKFTLSASSEDDEVYTVYINLVGEDPYMVNFSIFNQIGDTEFAKDYINIIMPYGTNLKKLTPTVEVNSENTTYSPMGEVDFSRSKGNPVVYTLTNQYGVTRDYYVTVTSRDNPSSGGGTKNPLSLGMTSSATYVSTTEPYINGYSENGLSEFRPDNTITRAEVAKILSVLNSAFNSSVKYTNNFTDSNADSWYSNYIGFAAARGYISGYEDGTVHPEANITRAEFAVVAARFMGLSDSNAGNHFNDMDDYEWCSAQVNALSERGIINGYGNNEFRPGNTITRAEAVAIINRMIGRRMTEEIRSKLSCPFTDISSEHWAYSDVLLAACKY